MNKSRVERGIYKSVAAILIANNFVTIAPIKIDAEENFQKNKSLIHNMNISKDSYIDMNGDFEDVFKSTSLDKDLWGNNVKPRNWEISSYSSFPATMMGEITNDSKNGKNAVKINLNKSIGFFKTVTSTSPKIEAGKKYEISLWSKSENLVKDNCNHGNHSPILIKAEQLDISNKTIETTNLANISGTNGWTNYSTTIEAKPEAQRLRLVVVFDSGLHGGTSGNIVIDNFKLKEITPKPNSINLDRDKLKIAPGHTGRLNYNIDPIEANKEPIIWESSDTSVVEIKDGIFKGIKPGTADITAKLNNYEDIKSQCSVKVSDSVGIEKVEFEKQKIDLYEGKNYIVKAKTYPEYTTEEYFLESKNTDIAKIKDGIVSAIKPGITNIIAKNIKGEEIGRFELNIKDYKNDKYDELLSKIYKSLVPNNLLSVDDKEDMLAVKKIVDVGENYWKNMNKDKGKDYLWNDLDSTTNSNHITKSFERLREMAKAYLLEGSSLKNNPQLIKDIEYGLEWLMENRYNKGYYNNWWDWQIGIPQRLTDTLVLIRDYLTTETIEKYTDIISYYVANARDQWSLKPETHTQSVGANRLDMCQVVIYKSLLVKNGDKIQEASNDLLPELKYVTNGDGFYEDGSIIQHTAIPYTGTYGSVLLSGIGRLNYILEGTQWAIPNDKVNMVYDVIEKSFEPLMYKGLIMDMVNGRSISRSKWQDVNNGESVMKSIVKYFIPAATNEESNRLKGSIKYWLESNDSKNMVETTNDLEFRAMIKEILNDNIIKPRGELIGHYNYANMDRVVHRSSGFVYGISKYSDRTYMYEAMNKENLKGYHTADGMTYLYNGDVEQFSKGFWPTVNPKRLPGTTVDTVALYDEASGSKVVSDKDWVGGSVIDGKYGASGMYLDKVNPKEKDENYKMDLKAKKSWFMFDDEIVALGSGITSSKNRNIETIIENRRLSEKGDEVFTVDGETSVNNIADSKLKEDARWAHIKGNKENTDIGYYFPNKANINILREHRTGNWNNINGSEADKVEENNFLTMWIDHGINPQNKDYSYVLLPNKSKDEVKKYNENPDIEVLENSEVVHAVKEKKLNITAVNLWEDNQGIDFIHSNKKASIMVRENNGELTVVVSDPTMKNKDTIRVEINKKVKNLLSKDERVKIIDSSDKLILEVNVKNLNGSTVESKFDLL
ncbi:polysaccharide lyase family 8 super-sandwich domain-containing protein [Faecalimicrobium sp. JNUCC 81]